MRDMTVGELVYKQAIENGYDPEKASGVLSPVYESMQRSLEQYKNAFKNLEAPIKMVNSAVESMRPQLDMLSNVKIPTIPDFMFEDREMIIPKFNKVQDVRIVDSQIPARSEEKESEFIIHSYLLPKGATWESLLIEFLDGHFVRVSYPNMKVRTFDYKDMGFLNGKTRRPDRKWELFKAIADNEGALTNKDRDWSRNYTRNVKYELNIRLKKFFGMNTNPISNYTKKRGYEALFTIKSDK